MSVIVTELDISDTDRPVAGRGRSRGNLVPGR